jgi:hypothetical protein
MTFIIVLVASMLMAYALREWQRVEVTAARWRLYALRDELRWQAIESGELRNKALFHELDESITAFCAICQMRAMSLWMFTAVVLIAHKDRVRDEREKKFFRDLAKPANVELHRIFDAAVWQVIRMLVWRHVFLTVLLVPTLVGAVGLLALFFRVARMTLAAPLDRSSSFGRAQVA